MIKPDLIVIWPYAFDYPRFREFVVRNRSKFNKVIVSFTNNSVKYDFRNFYTKAYKDWTFVNSSGPFWYHDAIVAALKAVESTWVLFMEQDFLCTDLFLEELLATGRDFDFSCYLENERLHLCCFLTRMDLINKTSKFFAHIPERNLDNFDLFTQEMKDLSNRTWTFSDVDNDQVKHLSGLTQNYQVIQNGNPEQITNPREFWKYNQLCMRAKVPIPHQWREIMDVANQKVCTQI
jgi:molybdopterin-guanine dinucleotide biosynthesis protein A